MGFRVSKRVARIVFEKDHEYHGLEVVAALDVPMRTMFELEQVGSEGSDNQVLLERFGNTVLVEWNLEGDDGTPVPATGEGFLSLPISLASTLMGKWSEAATAIPAPLGQPSKNGNTSVVPSTLTEPSLENL